MFLIAPVFFAVAATTAGLPSGHLEEVIITAQKREQSLQDTPIAVTAYDVGEIEQRNIGDIGDIGTSVPNVNITQTAGSTTAATISIRGSVTFNPAITWEPTVGIYTDGIFIGKNLGGLFDVVDLERIEILRGPQGTLYGKNTVGGAVNLITLKPAGEFGGKIAAGVGNYGLRTGYAGVDLPALQMGAAGQLKTKLIGSYKVRDGLYRNEPDPYGNTTVTTPPLGVSALGLSPAQPGANPPSRSELSDLDRKVMRFDALWDVNEQLDIRYMYDYSNIDQAPPKQQLTNVDRSDPSGLGMFIPLEFEDYLTKPNDNRRTTSSDESNFERSKSIAHTLIANYDIGSLGVLGNVSLRYLGNHRRLDWDDSLDIDGSPLNLFHTARYINYHQESQELQWLGATERTNYVVGLYYFKEEADVYNPVDFFAFLYADPVGGSMFHRNNNYFGMDNTSFAVFGQMEWRPPVFNDHLTLTAGLRWTSEKKKSYINHPNDAVPFSAKDHDTYNNVSPTVIAAYNLTDNINVYGKLSKGWKSGGFNGEAPSEAAFLGGYKPEEITSYEIGMKSRWWDNRLQFNAAVFHNKSTDMQVSVYIAGGGSLSTVDNAGEATLQGFELELMAIPVDDLRLTLNYGYLDAKYDKFMDMDNTVTPPVRRDFRDQRDFAYTPRHSASASVEYTITRFNALGALVGFLDYEFTDHYFPYINPAQNATSKINSYQLVNGRISLQDIPMGNDKNLRIALWGKNLLNKEYRNGTVPFGAWTVSYFGDPRTYGIEATLQF